MDVRCEKCNTEYDFDDARITEAGVTVKCTQCGFVFKVKKRTSRPPALSDELPPELSSVDKTREWKIRQASGNIYTCRELTTLQKWIVERKVAREDEISLTGDTWKRLGNIPELAGFFIVVDQAARAAIYEQQIQAGVPLVPSAPSMPVAPPPRPISSERRGPALANEPAWSGLAEPAESAAPAAPRARPARQEEVPPEEQAPDEDDLAAIRTSHSGRWIGAVVGLVLAAGGGYFAYSTYLQRTSTAAAPVAPQPAPKSAPVAPPPVIAAPTGPVAPTGAVAAVAPTGPSGPRGASGPTAATGHSAPVAAAGSSGATSAPPPAAVVAKPEVPPKVEAHPKPEVAHDEAPPATHPTAEKKPAPQEGAPAEREKPVAVATAEKPAPQPGGGGNYDSLMKQGRSLQQHDKSRKALELFMQAIEIKPGSAEAWVGKGDCLYDLDRSSEAVDAFKQALTFAPGFGEASLGLAQAYKSEGQKDAAIRAYQAYLAGNPSGENADIARRNLKDLSE